MVHRDLAKKKKFRKLSLHAKTLLPLMWAWADDQGRFIYDPDQIMLDCPALLDDFDEEKIEECFLEYENGDDPWGFRYETDLGLAWQWYNWHRWQTMRRKYASEIPRHETVTDELKTWQQERTGVRKNDPVATQKAEARLNDLRNRPDDLEAATEQLRARYTRDQKLMIDEVFSQLAMTRRNRNIAPTIIYKELAYWSKFPVETVIAGVTIFVNKAYWKENKQEAYLRGIIRKWEPGDSIPIEVTPSTRANPRLVATLTSQFHIKPDPAAPEEEWSDFRTTMVGVMVDDFGFEQPKAIETVRNMRVKKWGQKTVGEVELAIKQALQSS